MNLGNAYLKANKFSEISLLVRRNVFFEITYHGLTAKFLIIFNGGFLCRLVGVKKIRIELRGRVTERPMPSARAFQIFTVQMKKGL